MTLFRNTKKHKMNSRLFLYSALTFIIILLIDAWDRDYSQPSTETTIIQNEIPETNIEVRNFALDTMKGVKEDNLILALLQTYRTGKDQYYNILNTLLDALGEFDDPQIRRSVEEIAMNEPLLAKGDVSKTEILRLQREEAELVAKRAKISNDYFQNTQAEYNETEEEFERVSQLLIQRKKQLDGHNSFCSR